MEHVSTLSRKQTQVSGPYPLQSPHSAGDTLVQGTQEGGGQNKAELVMGDKTPSIKVRNKDEELDGLCSAWHQTFWPAVT